MAVVYPGGFNEDGVSLGGSTEKMGLYGVTPVEQPTITDVGAVALTAAQLTVALRELQMALVDTGIVKF